MTDTIIQFRQRAVGFTGTRRGMTPAQLFSLEGILDLAKELNFTEFHHGMCVGADEEAHILALGLNYRIIGHPPDVQTYLMKYDDEEFADILTPKPYLDRNRDIVDVASKVVAAPKEENEVVRSGTWSTVRYTKRRNKFLIIVKPDGGFTYFSPR